MSLGDALQKAADDGGQDFDPPDGPHQVKVIDGGAFTARTSGKDFAKVKLQIIGGDDAGRQFDHLMSMSERALPMTAEALLGYGIAFSALDDLEDLDHALFELVGTEADIIVRHSNGFTNVSVTGSRTGQSDVTPPNEPAEPVKGGGFAARAGLDDSIPF